jgi:hypothetical protein
MIDNQEDKLIRLILLHLYPIVTIRCELRSNTEARIHCCSGKATSFAYSECVLVALGMQQAAMRMRRVMLPSVACPAAPRPYTLSHKRHDLREKGTEYKMPVLVSSSCM